jgi:hypothetical protein
VAISEYGLSLFLLFLSGLSAASKIQHWKAISSKIGSISLKFGGISAVIVVYVLVVFTVIAMKGDSPWSHVPQGWNRMMAFLRRQPSVVSQTNMDAVLKFPFPPLGPSLMPMPKPYAKGQSLDDSGPSLSDLSTERLHEKAKQLILPLMNALTDCNTKDGDLVSKSRIANALGKRNNTAGQRKKLRANLYMDNKKLIDEARPLKEVLLGRDASDSYGKQLEGYISQFADTTDFEKHH